MKNKIIFALPLLIALSTPLHAAEITLLAGAALRNMLAEALPAFAGASGHQVKVELGIGFQFRDQAKNGKTFDAVLLTLPDVDGMLADGNLVRNSNVNLFRAELALIVKKGESRPDISTADKFKQVVLDAPSVAVSEQGPSGVAIARIFSQLSIADSIKSRLVLVPPGKSIPELVVNGHAQFGVQQLSEVVSNPDVEVVGTLPAELGATTVFTAAVSTKAADPKSADVLIAWLQSQAFGAFSGKFGFLAPR